MKEILENIALIDLTKFCLENKIDCSGTRLYKNGRGFKYSLIRQEDEKCLVGVQFTKNSVPIHYIYN